MRLVVVHGPPWLDWRDNAGHGGGVRVAVSMGVGGWLAWVVRCGVE